MSVHIIINKKFKPLGGRCTELNPEAFLFYMELVFTENGKHLTSSRLVATKFGKKHKDVLKALRSFDLTSSFNQRNFTPIEYIDSMGRKQPEYVMTKDGFTFLVMGFTGEKADQFKIEYIEEFNRKTETIQLPQTKLQWMQLAVDTEKQKQLAESKVQSLEEALDESEQWISIVRASIEYGIKETYFKWRVLKKYSLDHGIEIKSAPCPRFKTKKLYHISVFKNCYTELSVN